MGVMATYYAHAKKRRMRRCRPQPQMTEGMTMAEQLSRLVNKADKKEKKTLTESDKGTEE